jgi:hypothetical protein
MSVCVHETTLDALAGIARAIINNINATNFILVTLCTKDD